MLDQRQSDSPASTLGPSQRHRVAILLTALAFLGATAWQVATQRDDWPLSAYKMYSGRQGKTAHRAVFRGVSDSAEFPLEPAHVYPFSGSRLRHLSAKLASRPKRQAGFLKRVQTRYEARKQAEGWPELQAIRSYSETWTIRPGLTGIERPRRRETGSYYLPPKDLLTRLDFEREGNAPPPSPRQVPMGEVVAELEESSCTKASGCELTSQQYASGSRAVRLKATKTHPARTQATLALEPGNWLLLVRMRSTTNSVDRVVVSLDGKKIGEVGNYAKVLGRGSWVWASRKPGARPLKVVISKEGVHRLQFRLPKGELEIDQLWLTQSQRELPIFNEPVRR